MSFENFIKHLSDRRKSKFLEAVEILRQSKENGVIRNVIFNSIKDSLNRAVDEAFCKNIKGLSYDNYMEADSDIKKLSEKNIMSLHDIISAHKLVNKIKNQSDPFVVSYKLVIEELIDLAIDLKEIKNHIVKGRIESEKKIQEENPNKLVRTCPCCFRAIALTKSGTMVHHGFQRPGDGYQTPSCYGVDFEPYERSDKGVLFMLKLTSEQLENSQHNLKKLEVTEILLELDRKTKKIIEYKVDHPEFRYKKSLAISRNKYEVEQLTEEKFLYQKKAKEWKKVE